MININPSKAFSAKIQGERLAVSNQGRISDLTEGKEVIISVRGKKDRISARTGKIMGKKEVVVGRGKLVFDKGRLMVDVDEGVIKRINVLKKQDNTSVKSHPSWLPYPKKDITSYVVIRPTDGDV